MFDGWAGLILVGGAAELAGGGEPHRIAGAAAGLGFAWFVSVGGDEALFLGAEGGADEMGTDFAALEGVALAEIAVNFAGGPGDDGVEALLVVEDFAAEGSVGGQVDIDIAILDESLAALFFLIGDGFSKAVEDGHFLTAPERQTFQHGHPMARARRNLMHGNASKLAGWGLPTTALAASCRWHSPAAAQDRAV